MTVIDTELGAEELAARQDASIIRQLSAYQVPDRARAVWQVVNSFLPFIGLWILMVQSLKVGYWLTFLLAIPTAGFLIRIFIIQHDCGHGSFVKSKRVRDALGFVCGVMTFTPYGYWRLSHAIHHATSGNLAKRGIGDVKTLTVHEYQAASRWRRLKYRVYRNPLVLFGVGAFLNFVVFHRLPLSQRLRKEWASVHWTNLALGAVALVLVLTIGLKTFLLVQSPIMAFAATSGVWLFYVQHQYEDVYWAPDDTWDYTLAALRGSSFYNLPAPLRWITGNIGYHHIHHLSPSIPNYRLRECHDFHPAFQEATELKLGSSFKTASLALYDEDRQQLISFRALAAGRT